MSDSLVIGGTPIVSEAVKAQVLSSFKGGSLHTPTQVSGIECDEAFFALAKDGTHEVTILSHEGVVKSGRTTKLSNGAVVATGEDVYRALCTLQIGTLQAKLRLHLCDLLPLVKAGGKGKMSFGTYYPDPNDKGPDAVKYLVPKAAERYTASEIAAAMEA
jgi:hypothetical protein